MPLTVKLRTGVQERVNLAHRLLPDLRDWGAALVTVGLGAERASGPRGPSLSNYPSLLSPLCWSLARPLSLVSVCPSLCLSLSQSVSSGISGSLSLSLSGPPLPWPPLPSPHGRLSSSSMAARGSSATPSWPTGSTSSSAWQQPAPCPFLVGPHRSHTQARPSPGPSLPIGGSRAGENSSCPGTPAQHGSLRPRLLSLREWRHLVLRGCQPSPADWCCRGHDRAVRVPWGTVVALVS